MEIEEPGKKKIEKKKIEMPRKTDRDAKDEIKNVRAHGAQRRTKTEISTHSILPTGRPVRHTTF